jgi:hypothetical protein
MHNKVQIFQGVVMSEPCGARWPMWGKVAHVGARWPMGEFMFSLHVIEFQPVVCGMKICDFF